MSHQVREEYGISFKYNCYPCEVINQIRWIPNKGEKLNASQLEIGMYKSEEEILTRQAYIVAQTREAKRYRAYFIL